MSLSALKDSRNMNNNTQKVNPIVSASTKEASDERKASLKDVLAKVNMNNHTPIIEVKKEDTERLPETPEVKEIVQKEEIKPEPTIQEEVKKEEKPKVEDTPIIDNNQKPDQEKENNSWKKRKAKKEVPEDILRKVLEE